MITYGLFLYIILTAVVVFLAFGIGTVSGKDVQAKNPYTSRLTARNRVIALAIFILLSAVSVCRIAVGNDYWVYRDNFNLIAQDRHVSYEIGFRYVVKFTPRPVLIAFDRVERLVPNCFASLSRVRVQSV